MMASTGARLRVREGPHPDASGSQTPPEKGLQEALETNNQGQIRRWAPQKEAADRARSLLAQVGGDWAFVVERIEPHGEGRYLVHTTEDHGLDIDGDTTEEFAHPRRRIAGPTGLVIYPMACSQLPPRFAFFATRRTKE